MFAENYLIAFFMKKLLFLFVFVCSLAKAQNDSLICFVYTDNNNNCIYEPGSGEQPLINFALTFDYKFSTSFIQSNTKTTDNFGYAKFYAPSAFSPSTNTVVITSCNFGMNPTPQLSTCFANQNLAYNTSSTSYSVGVYSPVGSNGFQSIAYMNFSLSTPGAPNASIYSGSTNFYCIGKSSFQTNIIGCNYLNPTPLNAPVDLSFQGGSISNQMGQLFTSPNQTGCAFNSAPPFIPFGNNELQVPGVYTVTINGQGMPSTTFTLVVDSCSAKTGNVYVDCNTSCSKDVAEYNCSEEVLYSTNGIYSAISIPDYNGNYSVLVPYSATQYSMTITPNVDFALACSTPSYSTYYSNSSSIINSNIVLNQTAVNNINYSTYVEHPYSGSSVPGGHFKFRSYYHVSKPDFCTAVNNAGVYYVKLDQNSQLASVAVGTPTYSAIYPTATGDSIVWTLADLRTQAMNLGGHNFVLNIDMKTTATMGLLYSIISGVISNVTETTLMDNRMVGSWLVGGPFDPNYIEVTPAGTGVQGYIPTTTTELLYTIHFQNVGNAPAINVKVKNMLDTDLEKNSIKVLGSSAPVQTNVDGNGMVTFMFNNIMLADSTHDEPRSHGFVTYKINLKPSLAVGTQIHNTAGIYFDFNTAVLTNTVLNTIQSPTGVKELNSSSFEVYPNPSNGLVNINSTETITKVTVVNILGETIRSISSDSKQVMIDISDLKSNVYFLQITDAKNQTSIQKIVKE